MNAPAATRPAPIFGRGLRGVTKQTPFEAVRGERDQLRALLGKSPQQVLDALAPHWTGEITNVEIAQDVLGWAVRVTVQSTDKRRRAVTWSETGETRAEAINEAIEAGGYAWPKIHGMGTS